MIFGYSREANVSEHMPIKEGLEKNLALTGHIKQRMLLRVKDRKQWSVTITCILK